MMMALRCGRGVVCVYTVIHKRFIYNLYEKKYSSLVCASLLYLCVQSIFFNQKEKKQAVLKSGWLFVLHNITIITCRDAHKLRINIVKPESRLRDDEMTTTRPCKFYM